MANAVAVREKLLTAEGVGEMLSLSKRQIFRLNSSGKIPAPVKIGGSVRWRAGDIDRWIEWGCPNQVEFKARKGVI